MNVSDFARVLFLAACAGCGSDDAGGGSPDAASGGSGGESASGGSGGESASGGSGGESASGGSGGESASGGSGGEDASGGSGGEDATGGAPGTGGQPAVSAECEVYCDCHAEHCADIAPIPDGASCAEFCAGFTAEQLMCRRDHCLLVPAEGTHHCEHSIGILQCM